jgi:hypothetical protein
MKVSIDCPEAETQSPAPLFDRFASGRVMDRSRAFVFGILGRDGCLGRPLDRSFISPIHGQLVINTGTTGLTVLTVFIIQNTINRDATVMHLKLDKLLRVTSEARDNLMGTETLGEAQIKQLHAEEV